MAFYGLRKVSNHEIILLLGYILLLYGLSAIDVTMALDRFLTSSLIEHQLIFEAKFRRSNER